MPRPFSHTTAELTVLVVEAVQVQQNADIDFVKKFCDLSEAQTRNALDLALDIGLVKFNGTEYNPGSPLLRFISNPKEVVKAALLRVLLESYEPFLIFRTRLKATNSADTAAQQTKTILDLEAHREEIKDTLISLGTYTNAIHTEGGGRYKITSEDYPNHLRELSIACDTQASAEMTIRNQIGSYADELDQNEVIRPLSSALLKSSAGQRIEAVNEASTAIESFLFRLAQRMGANLAGTNGLGQKLDRFRQNNLLPKKLVESGKYLVQIRNAADHGVDADPDVGAVWIIQESTAIQYVFVACSFIRACGERENNRNFEI